LKKICARAGKKEGGWGEGIFARPRFSAAAGGEMRLNYLKNTEIGNGRYK